VAEVVHLVVERPHDALEIGRQPIADVRVELRDAIVAESVFDPLLVLLAERVQLGEEASRLLEPLVRQPLDGDDTAFDVAVERDALATELVVVATLAVGYGLRAGEAELAKKEEQIELALHVELALHLVDAQEMLPARRLEHVV